MDICYRQCENVGERAKFIMDVIADESSPKKHPPFKREYRKNHQQMIMLSNTITFVNPAGYVNHYQHATINGIQQEVARIASLDHLLWKDLECVLVVDATGNDKGLPKSVQNTIGPLYRMTKVRIVTEDELNNIKGMEYQHAFVFLNPELYRQLHEGEDGLGRKNYRELELMRIPFSRARYSLVTFVLGDEYV